MKGKLNMILFVIVLGAISSGILTTMDSITNEKIESNKELAVKASVLTAFDMEFTDETIEEIFKNNIEAYEKDGTTFYSSTKGEVGFSFSGSGLWGPIEGTIALNPDLETIKGIKISAQEETPGLGGVVAEQWYLEQFKGKKVTPSLVFLKTSKENKLDNEIDGISGATLTSNAFELLLNTDIKKHKEILMKK